MQRNGRLETTRVAYHQKFLAPGLILSSRWRNRTSDTYIPYTCVNDIWYFCTHYTQKQRCFDLNFLTRKIVQYTYTLYTLDLIQMQTTIQQIITVRCQNKKHTDRFEFCKNLILILWMKIYIISYRIYSMIADHSIFYTYTHVAKGITHTHNGSLTILVYKCFRF